MTHELLEKYANNLLDKVEQYKMVQYPIYIPSKARPKKITAAALEASGLNYLVVVEPQDWPDYLEIFPPARLLKLPENDQGIHYVRNFCKIHSRREGWEYHWQMDDNIRDFRIRRDNKNVKCEAINVLSASEEYVREYDNIGILGLCHVGFAFARKNAVDVNKQVYSCVLVNNHVPVNWRPDVVEDTDYSLQVLEQEMCTLLINRFCIGKETTTTNSGGNDNSDEWRMKRSLGLQKYWPGAFTITEQYGRVKVNPSRIWRKYTHMPRGQNIDLNGNDLSNFF